ncbi:GOLPH3/VPS74 family protein [Idiomarina abyssalis]|uniref:GOLPH3/VPS74 family protein n=1 Tax=Idiomarina abyssalis TaxID=86102 RepID=UPI0006C831D6|nr:GPP34 family phosphoprotein [Idiomarina abyssalis]KPD22445.1 phosphoprotein 3 (GPP34) [Idiomarina abyssalis]SFT41013.1 Golgi phosphoprotein 3 (GPP34) [Idiomarina abyssalis]
MPDNLKLYEAIVLLALCEEKGTMNGAYVEYATAAALAAELLMLGRIKVDDGNNEKIAVVNDSPTGDSLLDEALTMILDAKRQYELEYWVEKLAGIKDLKHKVAQALATDGIVASEKEKVLWLFERRVYPEVNPEPEEQLRQEMRNVVLSDGDEIEPRIAIVVALANSAALLPQVFTKQELKDRKQRIKQLEKGELVSKAAKEAVQAIEAAVMIAAIMPAITAATVTSSPSSC